MTTEEHMVTSEPELPPVYPGQILRDSVLPALDLSIVEFARILRVSRQTVHAILSGRKAITPAMALRLGKFLGNGAGIWLRMQQDYDLWRAEEALAEELAQIPRHHAA
jgi:addiction module HigA family antidote